GTAVLGPLAESLDLPDLEAAARDGREELANARIDPAADAVIALPQRLAAGGLEAMVGAQIFEELGEASLKMRLPADRIHLAADPRDLAQPEIVDIIGSQRQRGILLDKSGIEPGAAAHGGEADLVARMREIVGLQEVAE